MSNEVIQDTELRETMLALGRAARRSVTALAGSTAAIRDRALSLAGEALRDCTAVILEANEADMADARHQGLGVAMLDRLSLDAGRVAAIADGLDAVAALPDPLGRLIDERTRPNGLTIQRVSVPLGVIAIIYESRPNVTADAGALCLKAGNASILRGGSESFRSSAAIFDALLAGVSAAGLPAAAIARVPTRDRAAVGLLLEGLEGTVDVVVPRGGRGLIERVQSDARVPVIGHLEGLCHVYVHAAADPAMAVSIVANAKMRRTGICGAAETLLIDAAVADRLLPDIAAELARLGCALRGDRQARDAVPGIGRATEDDWRTEYLDATIAVRVVGGLDEAIDHIREFGSGHTDAIVTNDAAAAERFLNDVDSAIVMHNASTQFADGGEFGMGAEIGIATGRIHARGPVGANELTSYKFVVRGSGQTRA